MNNFKVKLNVYNFLGIQILVLFIFTLVMTTSLNAGVLYTVNSRGGDANLRIVDESNGQTLSLIGMTLSGETIRGGQGLARDPTSGICWAILSVDRILGGRLLVTLDVNTGAATLIGNTTDRFAGIAFDSSGTLFGITGDGGSSPETLFTLSKIDGSPTFFQTLGNGGAGETIAFNPNDGLLYHGSGFSDISDKIFETVNLNNNNVTNIPLSGDNFDEFIGLVHQSGNSFLFSDFSNLPNFSNLYSITTGGVVSLIGGMDHVAKGLAFNCQAEPPPPPISDQEPGDANGDGEINILDVTVILNEILEISSAPGNGDCNEDGNVNILDVTCVLNIILQG